uniref:Uncharacterized protein n=1 Tax=Arundo donax TaxID=35708 RepID=A0A0A9E0W7_ARUDO
MTFCSVPPETGIWYCSSNTQQNYFLLVTIHFESILTREYLVFSYNEALLLFL